MIENHSYVLNCPVQYTPTQDCKVVHLTHNLTDLYILMFELLPSGEKKYSFKTRYLDMQKQQNIF